METIIEAKQLNKYFKLRKNNGLIKGIFYPDKSIVKAVENINFTVKRGESVAFLGPNGAGKTTTTKMLTGLIFPTTGDINVLGYVPFDRKPEFLRRIGLVMGNKTGLNWDLTPNQSFYLLKSIYKISDVDYKNRIEELSELLNVKEHLNTQLRRLSLGERMKMEIIGAILHNPELLFLDEPTIGLDIVTKKNIRLFLRDIQERFNTTLILTSHDMDDIEKVCDRVIVINHGQKVYDDSLATLTAKHKKERFVRFVFNNDPLQTELEKIGNVIEYKKGECLFKVSSSEMIHLITASFSTFDVLDMHIESAQLEDIISDIFKNTEKI